MLKIFLALAAASLMIAGCTGDPLTQDNGRVTADAGHTHSDVGQSTKQDTAVCTPKCGGKNCGDNGCGGTCGACDSDETCNGASLCTPKSAAHACAAGATCDVGERCWCDASGAFTCYALTGMCVTTNGKETCESTSSYTSNCGGGQCVGADMSVKSAMCSADLYGCKKTGCATGLFCNSATGKCETDSSPGGGSGKCVLRQLDGFGFTAFGGGVSSIEMAEAGWAQKVVAAANGTATFTVGGASYFSFNVQRSDGSWLFGWDGIAPSNLTKVVGNWDLDCGLGVAKMVDGPQQPTCGSSLGIGGACYWAKPNVAGVYRVVTRLK